MRMPKFLYALTAGGAVAMLALSSTPAWATTVLTGGNQSTIIYDGNDNIDGLNDGIENVDLGDFNLSVDSVGVSAQFFADGVDGSFLFGVFADPLSPGAFGSVDVNLTVETFDPTADNFFATFDGILLDFSLEDGDWVTSFSTTFADISDIAEFYLEFSGFNTSDLIIVNVQPSSVPEPAAIGLFGLSLLGLGLATRRRRKN